MLSVVVDDHDMGVTHVIRGDDHLTNAARQTQIYRGAGLDRAGLCAHPADPRAGRREAVEAPRRARRRRLSRHGLPARGDAQLPAAARLEPRRRRDLLDRRRRSRGSTCRRSAARRARFDFAKLDNLNGHYIRQTADADLVAEIERVLPYVPAGAELAAKLDAGLARETGRRDAGPEGARQDPGRADRERALPPMPTGRSRSTTRPQALLTPEARGLLGNLAQRPCRGRAMERAERRGGVRAYAERAGREARRGGAAAACCADRPHDLPGHLRGAGGAGQGRNPGAARRPGRRTAESHGLRAEGHRRAPRTCGVPVNGYPELLPFAAPHARIRAPGTGAASPPRPDGSAERARIWTPRHPPATARTPNPRS